MSSDKGVFSVLWFEVVARMADGFASPARVGGDMRRIS